MICIDLDLPDQVDVTSEDARRAYEANPLRFWQANYERRAAADFAFDHASERREMWGACS